MTRRKSLDVTELQSKVQAYYDLHPTDYFVLQSLMLEQGNAPDGVFEQLLTVILKKSEASSLASLHLRFSGVRKLAFRQPEWSQISFGHLEVQALENSAEGGSHFSDQDGTIAFECRDFDASVARK